MTHNLSLALEDISVLNFLVAKTIKVLLLYTADLRLYFVATCKKTKKQQQLKLHLKFTKFSTKNEIYLQRGFLFSFLTEVWLVFCSSSVNKNK